MWKSLECSEHFVHMLIELMVGTWIWNCCITPSKYFTLVTSTQYISLRENVLQVSLGIVTLVTLSSFDNEMYAMVSVVRLNTNSLEFWKGIWFDSFDFDYNRTELVPHTCQHTNNKSCSHIEITMTSGF